MKRILFALALSILIHIVAFAGVATVQLLSPPKKNAVKIMYIKPVTLPKIQNKIVKKIETKTQPKVVPVAPKEIVTPAKSAEKIAIKPKSISNSLKPLIKPTPKPIKTPEPIKTEIENKPKKLTQEQIVEQKMQKKLTTLRSIPSVKNNKYWTEARLRRLELPPGINNWDEAKKLTEFFDTQYKWTYTPPALGQGKDPDINPYASKEPEPTPQPSSTDDINPEWKEYQEVNNEYSIRFYKDDIGFIAYFKENEKKVEISYFPFTPNPDIKDIEVKIPDNINPEDLKSFILPLTKEDLEARKNPEQDKIYKEQLIKDIIRTYKQQKTN